MFESNPFIKLKIVESKPILKAHVIFNGLENGLFVFDHCTTLEKLTPRIVGFVQFSENSTKFQYSILLLSYYFT